MKNLLTLTLGLCLSLLSLTTKAQYTIAPIAPPPNFTFNDLWHFTVVRSTTDNYKQFYVSLRVFDANNLLKIKSNTTTLSLLTGSHYYNLSNITDLQPFTTSYYDASTLQQVISSGGQFPPGTYNMVYTLFGKTADGEFVPLVEDVTQAIVETMWPPMLLSPPDGDTIETIYPLLTWTPAFSSVFTGQVTYTLNLVELHPGQNSYQAIQANPMYFTQNNIPVTMLLYPPYAQVLDTAKVYAWQVHADAQGVSMGSSEIWSFTWGKQKIIEETPIYSNEFFLELKPYYPEKHFEINEKVIRFRYDNFYYQNTENKINFSLQKEGSAEILLSNENCNNCVINMDKVYYSISLLDIELKTGLYLLTITDDKGNEFFLRVNYIDEK